MLGHLMGFVGFNGGLWREKTTPNGKACLLRVILGDFLRLCRANVGPFWVYVGRFHAGFCKEKNTTTG